jgi:hypothetical protein
MVARRLGDELALAIDDDEAVRERDHDGLASRGGCHISLDRDAGMRSGRALWIDVGEPTPAVDLARHGVVGLVGRDRVREPVQPGNRRRFVRDLTRSEERQGEHGLHVQQSSINRAAGN